MNTDTVFPMERILNCTEYCQHFIIPSTLHGSESRYQECFHRRTFLIGPFKKKKGGGKEETKSIFFFFLMSNYVSYFSSLEFLSPENMGN